MKVFITGGTSGLGLELAKRYLHAGHAVAVCGRDPSKINPTILGLKTYKVDVTNKEELVKAVNDFADGQLDIMVANAGISMGSKTKEPDFINSYQIMNTNINGVLFAFEAALPLMREHGGKLVGMSSLAAYNGLPGSGAYSASKSAVKVLCESLALDLRKTKVKVLCLCPGFIETPLTARNKHKMPFILDLNKGTDLIYNAIEEGKVLYSFPFPTNWVVRILQFLPRSWYRGIMSMKMFDYSL